MQDWVSRILDQKERVALPIMTYLGLDFTKKSIHDLVTNGDEHFNCIKALADYYPSAAAVSVMDLSIEAEAFGADIIFSKDDVPTIKGRLIKDNAEIIDLAIPKLDIRRIPEYLKASSLASSHITNKPVFSGMIGPFSLAGRLFDISEFMMNVLMDPVSSHALLRKCTDFLKIYAKAYKDSGANGLIIAEPAAGLLSFETCHEFSSLYIKEIVDFVQDDSFIVILHNCGNTVELVPTMVYTGAAGFHFGNAVNITDILPRMPEDRLVGGNIDPSGIFRAGNPDLMRKVVTDLLNNTKSFKNFFLSSGCDVPPNTPKQNVDAFYEALADFNSKI